MNKKLEKAIKDDIGKRGDKGVSEVLRVVEEECFDIATHASANWQDQALAAFWNRIGKRIDQTASIIEQRFGYNNEKHVR